jgi:hypothetical protein
LITPPNFIGGGGSCFPSSVTVALGEPGVPVMVWAGADRATNITATAVSPTAHRFAANSSNKPLVIIFRFIVLIFVLVSLFGLDEDE